MASKRHNHEGDSDERVRPGDGHVAEDCNPQYPGNSISEYRGTKERHWSQRKKGSEASSDGIYSFFGQDLAAAEGSSRDNRQKFRPHSARSRGRRSKGSL